MDGLDQLASELRISDKLIWTGARDDMPGVYNALDVVDSAWIVGNTGIVVPPKNPHALAAGWKSMLEINRKEMGIKSRSRIIERFSIKYLVDKTESVLWLKD
jgi:glycosyltransferase involved in cell wall biosynthesis